MVMVSSGSHVRIDEGLIGVDVLVALIVQFASVNLMQMPFGVSKMVG
jgi:hypothetical protein